MLAHYLRLYPADLHPERLHYLSLPIPPTIYTHPLQSRQQPTLQTAAPLQPHTKHKHLFKNKNPNTTHPHPVPPSQPAHQSSTSPTPHPAPPPTNHTTTMSPTPHTETKTDTTDATTSKLRKERNKRKVHKKREGERKGKEGAVFLDVSAFWKVERVVGGRVKRVRKKRKEVGKEIVV